MAFRQGNPIYFSFGRFPNGFQPKLAPRPLQTAGSNNRAERAEAPETNYTVTRFHDLFLFDPKNKNKNSGHEWLPEQDISIRSAWAPRDLYTTAVTTTRSTLKIEDPSLGPGRVDFRAPGGGFRLQGAPEPKIRRGPFQNSLNLVYGPPL
jgi:hypothetical protein